MSNSMNTSSTIRWQLLSTVSALALLASPYTAEAANTDADRPMIWIELGGQMENISGQGEVFTPPFLAANPTSPVLTPTTPLQAQRPPKFSFGEEGKISFQPKDSDWIFSAALSIGRSSNFRHVDHQTNRTGHYLTLFGNGYANRTAFERFADTQAHHKENHAILDFSVGKDIGLGLFGKNSSSVLSVGVRFAQFGSKATFDIRARPDLDVQTKYLGAPEPLHQLYYNSYHATGRAERSFHGVGPFVSWKSSVPVAGNSQDGEISFDWDANATLLFGRQMARVRHEESGHHFNAKYTTNLYSPAPAGRSNVRSVTVPNVGGSVGLSWHVEDFKVSLGYRADFFFGAMDGGIDARKSETLGFKGPFASISVGLGN